MDLVRRALRSSVRSISSYTRRARVVLVGSGRMGRIRSSILYASPRFELAGVIDCNMDKAVILAELYQTTAYETLEDALRDGPVDGVVISSPTFAHAAMVLESTKYGLTVFAEKPVDETAEKIQRLFDSCPNICCGFQRRFDASYVAAAAAVKEIGKPVSASLFFADHPCPPKEFLLTGGNIIMDLAPHDIDFISQALQDDVVSVYATGTYSTEEFEASGIHDNATMVMKFSKGTIVTLFMSRSATYGYDQRCEIFGENGLISIGNEHTHSTVISNQHGIQLSRLKTSFPQRFHQAFESEMDAFADTLLNETPWPVTANDCIRVQKVADAASRSIELDQVVFLDYD